MGGFSSVLPHHCIVQPPPPTFCQSAPAFHRTNGGPRCDPPVSRGVCALSLSSRAAVQDYIVEKMGARFVEPPPFDLAAAFGASTIKTPLVFVLTTGSDPTKMFYQFAEERDMGSKCKGISLGP